MKNKKNNIAKKKTQAFFQIFLLVSMSIAVSFIFGEEVGKTQGYPDDWYYSFGGKTTAVNPSGVAKTSSLVKDGSIFYGKDGGLFIVKDQKVVPFTAPQGAVPGSTTTIEGVGKVTVGEKGQLFTTTEAATTEAATAGAKPLPAQGFRGLLKGTTFGTGSTSASVGGALLSGAVWGATVYGLTLLVTKLLGLSSKQSQSIAMGLGAGTFVGSSLYFLGKNIPSLAQNNFLFTGWGGFLVGAGIAAAIILLTYTKEKKEIVRFECLPWEAPLGGQNCERCNEDPLLPCSEYRCKSLGQACYIVNKGSAEEKCIWINREDTQAPHMTPLEEALKPQGLTYRPDPTISPPNTGFKIVKTSGGCLDPFTPLEFGVKTDEHAQCKLDWTLTETYDQMQFLFGDNNLFREEHVQRLRVPSPFTEENGTGPEIHNNGIYTLWARCIDANGNGGNSAAVAFRFCVNPGPDTSPPIIEGTSIAQGSPVQFNVDKVPIEVYTNEPSECKWSRQDKAFDAMENTMSCATQSFQINANLQYTCSGDLTGVKNRADNHFYFRCKDQPNKPENQRNLMTTSHHLLLKGTEELVITDVGPTAEFEGGGGTSVVTVNLTVETGHGANEGVATCYFSDINDESEFTIAMQGAGTTQHSQPLDLTGGQYTYYFKCVDAGGNSASANTTFNILIDNTAPKVIRVFRDLDNLKIITDEDGKCSYSLTSCNYNFEEGVAFKYENPTNRDVHLTPWDPGITYYIKCADLQNNQPAPTSCQIVVEGSEF